MDSNYANAGGGGGGGGGGGHAAGIAVGVGAGIGARYNASYYKDPAASCQRTILYNAYEPYGGSGTGVRSSSAYPYDADAEFKERTGMGKSKSSHLSMPPLSGGKLQQQQTYNANNCYAAFSQNVAAMATESANYYAYAYNQHHPYPQQQQQQQQYHHQSQLEQQYKYNMNAKSVAVEHQQQQQQNHQQQSHQQQQHQQQSAVNAMKMSTPEYGYAPYRHLQHPYYHPHYHHALSQKGGVGLMKTMPDATAMPYVNSKMVHPTGMGGARVPQYQANYPYHPHGYPAAVSAGHHTYQSQSVCDDSRWMWNGGSGSGDYQSSCRSAYPAYVNSSVAKQSAMWPTMPMQYPNSMSTGYPSAAAVTNPSCCSATQSPGNFYSQQYVKHQMQSISNAMNYDGSNNDLYSNPQVNAVLPPVTAPAKVYTDLNAQPQENSYQTMNASSYHQPGNCNAPTTLDYNSRYLQQQQTASPTSSSSATTSFNHHYYHNLHPYAHQTIASSDNQESLYNQQQGDTKIGVSTKSQSLRDFLTSWNEDEDECAERSMISTETPFMEQMHLSSDHYTQTPEQQHNGAKSNQIVENHLQFKGSFTTRPKIHVGITVDSTVEPDQYINLPDIIIDIEKSNKDVVSLPEDILVTTVPKIEKEEVSIKEEKPEDLEEPKPSATAEIPSEVAKEKRKFRRKILRHRRVSRNQKLRNQNQRNQRKSRVTRKPQRSMTMRAKKLIATQPRVSFNPQSLKCLCVSLINSEKFRNRILGQSEINSLINLTTDNEVKIDVVAALGRASTSSASTASSASSSSASSSSSAFSASDIPKLSDLCKNALNSSFDRDVLVINLDEILDSDNLFVVQCDINENILENYVDQQLHDNDQTNNNNNSSTNTNTNNITHDDLVEILNDNNNNYNSSTGSGNYIPTAAVTTNTFGIPAANGPTTATATAIAINGKVAAAAAVTSTIKKRKRCCSVSEVSNLPLDNAVEHNNLNSTNTIRTTSTNPLESHSSSSPPPPSPLPSPSQSPPPLPLPQSQSSQPLSPSLNSPCSRSCPATLCCPSSPLIEQNCPTQQITVGHEQLHEMFVLSGIVHDDVLQNDIENDDDHQRHQQEHSNDTNHHQPTATTTDDSELLMLVSAVATPSIHHEEIVPDNMKKFQKEKFLKYLHAKYVQGNLSEFYHANRIIKKYKKRIIKKILNIVR